MKPCSNIAKNNYLKLDFAHLLRFYIYMDQTTKKQDDFLPDLKSSFQEQLEDGLKKIQKLAQAVDAVRLFVAMVANTVFGPPEHMTEGSYGDVPAKLELLAYHLYPFFGVSNNKEITPWHINECLELLGQIFVATNWLEFFPENSKAETKGSSEISSIIRMRTRIIRGSAYPEQTEEEVTTIQGSFENWFLKRLGIGPITASHTLWTLLKMQEGKLNKVMPGIRKNARDLEVQWLQAKKKSPKKRSEAEKLLIRSIKNRKTANAFGFFQKLNAVAPDILPVGMNDLKEMEQSYTKEEWYGLIDLVGLTVTNRNEMTDPIEVRQKPLFVLPDNRFILVDLSNALDVLWNKFEETAKNDQDFFQKKYQRKKAEWLEKKSADCFAKIFPANNIYSNLAYPDPDKNGAATAELDVAIEWGPFLLLTEVKAKQFRMESQLGDVGRLRTDLKENVEDAFGQARRAARYINQTSYPVLSESSTGRKLHIQKGRIHRTYLITISQHHLAGLANDFSMLQSLGLFKHGEYPFSISIADLEILSEFSDGPDIFLHYIEQRLDIQKWPIRVESDELGFFGAYLNTRLQKDRISQTNGKDLDLVSLSGFSDRFDRWIMYKRGELSTPPTIRLDVPDEIQYLLSELRKREDDGARWIAFALLSMSDNSLQAIAHLMKELRGQTLTPGML